MKCPRDKHRLQAKGIWQIEGRSCPKCDGIWLSHSKVASLYDSGIMAVPSQVVLPEEIIHESHDRESDLYCPIDHSQMITYEYRDTHIDVCPACKGLWLEEVEMKKLWNVPTTRGTLSSRLFEVLWRLCQTKQMPHKLMQNEYSVLEEILKEKCADGPVYYLANPGNWGDGLIRYGARKFLHHVGIEFKELTLGGRKKAWRTLEKSGSTLIYGGGGGWCKFWDKPVNLLNEIHKGFRNIVVLPSTYGMSYALDNTTFFCRDMYESKNNMPNAIFCHDMAFYIGRVITIKGTGQGFFYREDKESSGKIHIPPDNNDISDKGGQFSEIYPFFEQIAEYSIIHTDRLHVAIASCLMGREVHLYPNSYFKNKAVFLSSIRDYYKDVHFHGE